MCNTILEAPRKVDGLQVSLPGLKWSFIPKLPQGLKRMGLESLFGDFSDPNMIPRHKERVVSLLLDLGFAQAEGTERTHSLWNLGEMGGAVTAWITEQVRGRKEGWEGWKLAGFENRLLLVDSEEVNP